MTYIPTPSSVDHPKWKQRNIAIAKYIESNSKVLDLGCGAKNLLSYIDTSYYTGIDYNSKYADIDINFNYDFVLPVDDWDYIVCSGLLEYLIDLDHFFKTIQKNSSTYIFSIMTNNEARIRLNNINAIKTVEKFIDKLEKNFVIENRIMLKTHNLFICKDLKI